MSQDDSQDDDLINPLTPWRSMAFIFVCGWGAVLLDLLGARDVLGRYGRGFNPLFLTLPFAAVAGYWVFWTAWKAAQRRHRRQARERRAMLGLDRQH
ncbi:hypothetical protein [Caulobacter sp. 602-1]|uniref:hypothetical protein n=1 Tax=Caulobacter sp. 602-1 TaxID=2492472 RepID=UPI000F63B001|nr:hypothetical protein [Caulobacter sp. 602-1]RRN65341.1 hypothetical protein EIK80_07265 [Caulobacter sp. 602-1]